jgi:hypothetical protein
MAARMRSILTLLLNSSTLLPPCSCHSASRLSRACAVGGRLAVAMAGAMEEQAAEWSFCPACSAYPAAPTPLQPHLHLAAVGGVPQAQEVLRGDVATQPLLILSNHLQGRAGQGRADGRGEAGYMQGRVPPVDSRAQAAPATPFGWLAERPRRCALPPQRSLSSQRFPAPTLTSCATSRARSNLRGSLT